MLDIKWVDHSTIDGLDTLYVLEMRSQYMLHMFKTIRTTFQIDKIYRDVQFLGILGYKK